MTRRRLLVGLMIVAALVLAACAAGPNPESGGGGESAGFWLGLWHGLIVPVTFVISLFTDTVNIYEVQNDGNWYDFGYVLGLMLVLSGAGGGAAGARR
jgi:hypothetical protein